MESVGTRLKNLRLEKGLTLEEVYKRTKIHLNILRAIEEDSLVGMNPVYMRGFLKIYCQLLGVDPKDYIPGYQKPQPLPVKRELSDALEEAEPFLKASLVKLGRFRGIRINWRVAGLAAAALILCIGLFNLGKFISARRHTRVKAPIPLVEKIEKKKTTALLNLRLGLRAREDSWVELKLDGRTVFRGVLKKGKSETWTAKERIDLSLGNAAGVAIELDGRPMPAVGRRGQVVKNIRITKADGLVVGR
jgi:cytoskeletal protein RodZ